MKASGGMHKTPKRSQDREAPHNLNSAIEEIPTGRVTACHSAASAATWFTILIVSTGLLD